MDTLAMPVAPHTLHLRQMQGEWTAQLAALDSQDREVAKSFVQAIIDLATLIRDLERSWGLPA
jgi:hypothetical protein